MHQPGLERWLSGDKHVLLFQRTRVCFPATTYLDSQLPLTSVPDMRPSAVLVSSRVYIYADTHIHINKNKIHLKHKEMHQEERIERLQGSKRNPQRLANFPLVYYCQLISPSLGHSLQECSPSHLT